MQKVKGLKEKEIILSKSKSRQKLHFEHFGRLAGQRIEGQSTAIIPCLLTAKVHDTCSQSGQGKS